MLKITQLCEEKKIQIVIDDQIDSDINIDFNRSFKLEYMDQSFEIDSISKRDFYILLQLLSGTVETSSEYKISAQQKIRFIFKNKFLKYLRSVEDLDAIIKQSIDVKADYTSVIVKAQKSKQLHDKLPVIALINNGVVRNFGNNIMYRSRIFKNVMLVTYITEFYEFNDQLIISGRQLTLKKKITPIISNFDTALNGEMKQRNINNVNTYREIYFTVKFNRDSVKKAVIKKTGSILCGNANKNLNTDRNMLYTNNYVLDLKKLSLLAISDFDYKQYIINTTLENNEAKIAQSILDYQRNSKRNIILISDRLNSADDNAEHLLNYINENETGLTDYEIYFVLSKNSKDYHRLSSKFNVIDPSDESYIFFLVRTVLIVSSHATRWIQEPSELPIPKNVYYALVDYKYFFIQHGILLNDFSQSLNRVRTHIDYFNTTTKREASMLLEGDKYLLSKENITSAGMARFDNLVKTKTSKQILFMPRWRNKICNLVDPTTGLYNYNPDFKNSVFCQGINKFLNDEAINALLMKHGYELVFVPHQNMTGQIPDFKIGPAVKLKEASEINYSKLIKESSLLITDFSSVALDAVFANIPVAVYFPDRDVIAEYSTLIPNRILDSPTRTLATVCKNELDLYKTIEEYGINQRENSMRIQNNIDKFYGMRKRNNCKKLVECIEDILNN